MTNDPIESLNLWNEPKVKEVFNYMKQRLNQERLYSPSKRNNPWPYAKRKPPEAQLAGKTPPALARGLRALLLSRDAPEDTKVLKIDMTGKKALIVCTNAARLGNGKPTHVFASEMTVPYYIWTDAGMEVDLASPLGGVIPVDPQSYRPVIGQPTMTERLAMLYCKRSFPNLFQLKMSMLIITMSYILLEAGGLRLI